MQIIRILSCLDIENDVVAAVQAPKLCSRSRFRGVRVIIICILSYMDTSDYVFCRVLSSKMMLWLEFWHPRCALARGLEVS